MFQALQRLWVHEPHLADVLAVPEQGELDNEADYSVAAVKLAESLDMHPFRAASITR